MGGFAVKKRIVGIVSLLVLTGSYLLVRYPLLDLHYMLEWPFDLLIPGAAVIVTAGIILGKRIVPVFTAVGYILGFFAGFLFQSDYYDIGGGRLNNMWIIWTSTYLTVIAAGIIAEIINGIMSKKKSTAN